MVSNVLKTLYANHVNLERLFELIEEEIDRVGAGHVDPNFETLTLALEYCADYPEHFHHPTEDLIYGMLMRRAPELARKIAILTADHKTLMQFTRSFSDAVANAVDSGATKPVITHGHEFLQHYRSHMEIEESEILPAAEKYLTRSDWSEIEALTKIPIDPLFTEQIREAYLALSRRIVAGATRETK